MCHPTFSLSYKLIEQRLMLRNVVHRAEATARDCLAATERGSVFLGHTVKLTVQPRQGVTYIVRVVGTRWHGVTNFSISISQME